jgi:hypothetical protein
MESAIERLLSLGLTEEELRRAFEHELLQVSAKRGLLTTKEGKP